MERNEFLKWQGQRIRGARVTAGYKQAELGEMIGTSVLLRYENGKRAIPADLLWKIAQVTGQPIQFFFPGE